jgi:PfaD family protein
MGAAYVLTGSVNQACVESGSSDLVRKMLAQAGQADVAMAPAADMFEMGVKVQILKRGTMFAMRAAKLYEVYRAYDSIEALPAAVRGPLEKDLFREPLEAVWDKTRAFFLQRDPSQVERAEKDPKHKLALVFRSYLGQASRWANAGVPDRALDYQIWCGPAMGAFNEWTRGSFLEQPEQRTVAQIARNLLEGAAVITRAQQLRTYGVDVPAAAFTFTPRPLR